jgi:hypothetical protein
MEILSLPNKILERKIFAQWYILKIKQSLRKIAALV